MKAIIRAEIGKREDNWYLDLIADSPEGVKALKELREDFGVWRDKSHVLILWNWASQVCHDKVRMDFNITEGPDLQNPEDAEKVLKFITDEEISEIKKRHP